jgi:hypothetical protein
MHEADVERVKLVGDLIRATTDYIAQGTTPRPPATDTGPLIAHLDTLARRLTGPAR